MPFLHFFVTHHLFLPLFITYFLILLDYCSSIALYSMPYCKVECVVNKILDHYLSSLLLLFPFLRMSSRLILFSTISCFCRNLYITFPTSTTTINFFTRTCLHLLQRNDVTRTSYLTLAALRFINFFPSSFDAVLWNLGKLFLHWFNKHVPKLLNTLMLMSFRLRLECIIWLLE